VFWSSSRMGFSGIWGSDSGCAIGAG
jgi:hypothetical protein